MQVSGLSFGQYLRERMLQPAGLNSTYLDIVYGDRGIIRDYFPVASFGYRQIISPVSEGEKYGRVGRGRVLSSRSLHSCRLVDLTKQHSAPAAMPPSLCCGTPSYTCPEYVANVSRATSRDPEPLTRVPPGQVADIARVQPLDGFLPCEPPSCCACCGWTRAPCTAVRIAAASILEDISLLPPTCLARKRAHLQGLSAPVQCMRPRKT